MYEKVLATIGFIVIILIAAWVIRGRNPDRSAGAGSESVSRRIRRGLEDAERGNCGLEDAERATSDRLREQAETIGRAGECNNRGQALVQKAKHILDSAEHTD